MTEFQFFVPGKPVAKARHRTAKTKDGNLVQYKDRDAELAELEIRRQWESAGSVKLNGAVRLLITALHSRPANHKNKSGLSAAGSRAPLPLLKPDIDNVGKLVMDALNKYAWDDDKQVVDLMVRRRWGKDGVSGMRVTGTQVTTERSE